MQETREIMTQHLAFAKWKESAFSTEQLKGVRWLLGARPKGLPEALLEPLTMTPMAQSMMMQLHVKKFLQDSRRVKASARKFVRASQEDFDKLSDYACIFAYLRQAAKVATSDSKVDDKLLEAFMARSLDVKSILYLCSAPESISFKKYGNDLIEIPKETLWVFAKHMKPVTRAL